MVPAKELTVSEGKLSAFVIVPIESSFFSNKGAVERVIWELQVLGKENYDQGKITNYFPVAFINLVTVE